MQHSVLEIQSVSSLQFAGVMNILAGMEKRPGSRISLDSITVSIIIKCISNFHQLFLIVIWYDVHYVITSPLHRYICDDIRAGLHGASRVTEILISDLISISHSSLTPSPGHHNLITGEEVTATHSSPTSQSENMSSLKRSLTTVFTCKH